MVWLALSPQVMCPWISTFQFRGLCHHRLQLLTLRWPRRAVPASSSAQSSAQAQVWGQQSLMVPALLMSNQHLLILPTWAIRPILAAHQLTTFSLATSTMTSSTAVSPLPLAFQLRVLSAMPRQESTVLIIANQAAFLVGARQGACLALSLHRRPWPHARVSQQEQLSLARMYL